MARKCLFSYGFDFFSKKRGPPRARYFDVVGGGLACCYDVLGYSSGVGSFLPGRFNHVVQACHEHPE